MCFLGFFLTPYFPQPAFKCLRSQSLTSVTSQSLGCSVDVQMFSFDYSLSHAPRCPWLCSFHGLQLLSLPFVASSLRSKLCCCSLSHFKIMWEQKQSIEEPIDRPECCKQVSPCFFCPKGGNKKTGCFLLATLFTMRKGYSKCSKTLQSFLQVWMWLSLNCFVVLNLTGFQNSCTVTLVSL